MILYMPTDKSRLRVVRRFKNKIYSVTIQEIVSPGGNVPIKDTATTSQGQVEIFSPIKTQIVCPPSIESSKMESFKMTPRKMKNLRLKAVKKANAERAAHALEVQIKVAAEKKEKIFKEKSEKKKIVAAPGALIQPLTSQREFVELLAPERVVYENGVTTQFPPFKYLSLKPLPVEPKDGPEYWESFKAKWNFKIHLLPTTRACPLLPAYKITWNRGTGKLIDKPSISVKDKEYTRDIWDLLELLSRDYWRVVPPAAITSSQCLCDVCIEFKPVWIDGMKFFDAVLPNHTTAVKNRGVVEDFVRKR